MLTPAILERLNSSNLVDLFYAFLDESREDSTTDHQAGLEVLARAIEERGPSVYTDEPLDLAADILGKGHNHLAAHACPKCGVPPLPSRALSS